MNLRGSERGQEELEGGEGGVNMTQIYHSHMKF